MFLNRDQLEQLTDYKRPSAQIRWLIENGYSFDVGASGRPKVLSASVSDKLGKQQPTRKHQPRFDRI